METRLTVRWSGQPLSAGEDTTVRWSGHRTSLSTLSYYSQSRIRGEGGLSE
jgi:hypothetical protein